MTETQRHGVLDASPVTALSDQIVAQPKPVTWEEFTAAAHGKDDERLTSLEQTSKRDPASGRIYDGLTGDDRALLVKFSTERVFSKFASHVAGEPTWVLKDFITIFAPGQEQELTAHAIVEPMHMWRFPREYERFKQGLANGIEGTFLKDWKPIMNETGLIKEMDNIGIQTVEHLASTSDAEGTKYIRSFLKWKSIAKKYIEGNIKTEATINLEKKLEESEAAHKADMAAMNDKLSKLLDLLGEQKNDETPVKVAKRSSYKK